MKNKTKLVDKRFGNKTIDTIFYGFVTVLIFLTPPLISYSVLQSEPVRETLTCKNEICKFNQLYAFSGNYTQTIKRPSRIIIDSSLGRKLGMSYYLSSNDYRFLFRTSYRSYQAVERDKLLIIGEDSNIKVVKNNYIILIIIIFNLIDLVFFIYCVKFFIKNKSFY